MYALYSPILGWRAEELEFVDESKLFNSHRLVARQFFVSTGIWIVIAHSRRQDTP